MVWLARGVVLAARILSQFGLTGRVECASACFREVEVVTVVKWIIRFFFAADTQVQVVEIFNKFNWHRFCSVPVFLA